MSFPVQCVCDAPGECSHAGRFMSPGTFAECKTNERFRYALAQIPAPPKPTAKPARKIVVKIGGAAKPRAKDCIHLGTVLPDQADCGCPFKLRRCDVHGVCTVMPRVPIANFCHGCPDKVTD